MTDVRLFKYKLLITIIQITAINPKPFLSELLNRQVIVRLKWGIEYHGKMASFDKYMNFQLLDASEHIDGELKGSLGEILIRYFIHF